MGTVANKIPIELQTPTAKERVMQWLHESRYPSRFRRLILQQWGEQQGVTITPEDYAQVGTPTTEPTQ
jgi:hypothetical protein